MKNFDILNEIGLFDPEKMNQGIFGFRRYENTSLSYTGIDMHEGEDVGGWDTVLRREEYESLYAKQQESMAMPDFTEIISPKEEIEVVTPKKVVPVAQAAEKKPVGPDWATILSPFAEGITVSHTRFGDGKITWIDKPKKYFKVAFVIDGQAVEKQFVFPDAFINRFLTIK